MTSRNNYNYSIIEREDSAQNIKNGTSPSGFCAKMGKKWDKFVLLMWKNWLLQYRKPFQTAVEIIAPVLFSILLVVIRSLVVPETHPPKTYTPFCLLPIKTLCEDVPGDFPNSNLSYFQDFTLIYSPNDNEIIDRSMNLLPNLLKFANITVKVEGFPNSSMLEAFFVGGGRNTTFAGVQFDDNLYNTSGPLPKDLSIALRFPGELRSTTDLFGQNNWHTNILYPVYQEPGPRNPDNETGATPSYYNEGFLSLQYLLTYILAAGQLNITTAEEMLMKLLEVKSPMIKMQRFPYASWVEDALLEALESFVGIIIMLSFVYTCINTVKVITTEKEKQLKEAMKIMGLPNWLHWTAWFLKSFAFLFISIVLMIILLKVTWYTHSDYSVFTYSNPLVMAVFLILYVCATITFCFAISVFFSNANTAATVAGLLWFLSYAPYLFLQQEYDQLTLTTKLVASLGSNTAMAYGFQLMLMFEGTSEGIQWYNIWTPNTPDDTLTLGLIMVMLIIDSIIYLLVAIYVEAVFPGEYGVPLPWYFPFTSTYWCGRQNYVDVEESTEVPITHEGEFFEKEPAGLKAGIQIRNLRKMFGEKAAVRNLSLNMYDNQITVLLGHNGAGKTTTMSMLTGMFPPTSGTALVGGYDIIKNMEGVRASLGLCPQHNILFDDLTVKEHLYFFSKLKGLDNDEIKKEIDNYVELLELQPKADSKSSTLSGGMKRKLCVGMALCGNSKVVMLDEPTAGMDPSARRALWDLLQKQKEGRTMLLTTHFMDEADLLGDRIAIMAGGELQCCGSSFFLKKKYGAGYHLIMDKSQNCDANKVTQLLKKHIPTIEIHGNVGSELSYLLAEDQASVFEEMLQDLEKNSEDLGIRSYGISLTTLEEVFMKVGADHGQEEAYNNGTTLQNGNNNKPIDSTNHNGIHETDEQKVEIGSPPLLSGFKLIENQILAMLMKKLISTIRSWVLLFIQNLLPVAFLIITIIVIRNMNNTGDLPKLTVTLDSYLNPVTLIEPVNPVTNDNTFDYYIKALGNHQYEKVDNLTERMLELTGSVPATVRLRYIIGATFQPSSVTPMTTIIAWFNNNPYHSPPLALQIVLNVVYKQLLGEDSSISFSNHPLPFTTDSKVQQLLQGNSMGFQLAFDISFGMAFVSSFYVLFYVRERVCKSKHLQFVSGVKVSIFWITAYVCDLIQFLLTICALLITLVAFQEDGYKTSDDLGRMFLLLFCFGVGMIPMEYIAAYFFDVPSTGYTRMTLFSVFTGTSAFLVVQVLGAPGLDLEHVADVLHWIFLIVPHYSLATGIRDVYTSYATNKMCHFFVDSCQTSLHMSENQCWETACNTIGAPSLGYFCCNREPNYYKWESPGIGRNLTYTFLFGVILFTLLLLIEKKLFSRIIDAVADNYGNKQPKENADEDSDVLEERQKIHNTPQSELSREYTLILKDVTKYYNNFLAVNGISLGVKQYECFGLLGINGAGKTTTFKMMTGDVKMTRGNAWVNNLSIKTQLQQVQKYIGYCPQFDALLDDLTAKESLTMFALLRGVALQDCKYIAEKLAKDFDFHRHLNKQVKRLSGGNKRKLSTAISLIGDPVVIYLDEPTTGMDPATKRYLWDAICKVRDSGKCVVLTSHTMEECEALCTRLAIMVNGNFKCLGSTQHLKNKFAEGYTLTIKIKKGQGGDENDTTAIADFVKSHFPKAILREKHQELLTYYIVDKSVPWSRMFGILERGKRELNIEDYSLGQSSLEQVFLTFTKHQI